MVFEIESFSTSIVLSSSCVKKQNKKNKTLKIIIIFTVTAFVSFKPKRRKMSVHAHTGTLLTLSFYCCDPWHWNLINTQEAIIQMWNLIHQISNKQTKQEACVNDCLALYIKTSLLCNISFRNNEGKLLWTKDMLGWIFSVTDRNSFQATVKCHLWS